LSELVFTFVLNDINYSVSDTPDSVVHKNDISL